MSVPSLPASSMFHGAHDNTFNGSTFNITPERIAAFDKLEKAASPSAFHSYVERPQPGKCYLNTRVDLLAGLEQWAKGKDLPSQLFDLHQNWHIHKKNEARNTPILWLSGGAGAGKSAIAQTFAEQCEDLGLIVASFFFFRTDHTRNAVNRLVATLAYQIARADTGAQSHIETTIHQDPHIFNRDLTKQFSSLIIDPLILSAQHRVITEEGQHRSIIIIDGLDECIGPEVQAGVVHAISNALRCAGPNLGISPRFLICSRPEDSISCAFVSLTTGKMHSSLDLSSDQNAHHDIYTFLQGRCTEIRETHPHRDLIPASWPSNGDLRTLMYNSSGHFVYAETVVKLVSNDPRPTIALNAILGVRALPQRIRQPYAELDELYHYILQCALAKNTMEAIRNVFSLVDGGITRSMYWCHTIERFLDLDDGELDIVLAATSSLVRVDRIVGRMVTISFYHRSFHDFLHDKSRSGEFHIEEEVLWSKNWARCMTLIRDGAGLGHNLAILVVDYAHRHHRSYDFSAGQKSYSLLGMTQRRDFNAFMLLEYFGCFRWLSISASPWPVQCFKYWLELSTCSEDGNLITQATTIMIDVIRTLISHAGPALPILMCQKFNWSYVIWLPNYGSCDLFVNFLEEEFVQSNFIILKRWMEDEQMGDCRLTSESFADACVFWMSYLTKIGNLFGRNTRWVLQHGLLEDNYPLRKRPIFFHHPWALRRYQKTGRVYFFHRYRRYHTTISDSELALKTTCETAVIEAYTTRELFFKWSDVVVPKNCRDSYRAGREKGSPLQTERHQLREFECILSRIPSMLEQASKSDSVAALRFKAFPPLCKYFPRLTRLIRRALDKYAIKHGYYCPYIDGRGYMASGSPRSELLSGVPTATTTGAPSRDVCLSMTDSDNVQPASPSIPTDLDVSTLQISDELIGCQFVIRDGFSIAL